MAYKTLNEYNEEIHPWEPFIPKNAERIILGTFPTREPNRDAYDFFYPNPNNDFWRILFYTSGKILNESQNDDPIEIRKQVLIDLKLGIADVGKKILRQRDSSKDNNLFPIEYTDIFSILERNPSIRKIILTSSSGSNSVLSWFHHYCILNAYSFNISKDKLPQKTKLIFINREIIIEIISSSSRLSPIRGERLFEMYRNAILNY